MKSQGVTIQMKAIEQYFPVVLFCLCRVVLALEPMIEILKCGHSDIAQYFLVCLCVCVCFFLIFSLYLTFKH